MTDVRARLTLGLLGVFVLATVISGTYRNYVRPGTWPLLTASGILLLLLAVHGALRQWRRHDAVQAARQFGGTLPQDASDHHDHHGSSWVLLLAPVTCLALLAPPSLGSYSAARAADAVIAPRAVSQTGTEDAWPPLPAGSVIPMTLDDFITRAQWDTRQALAGRTVRLTGFVLPPSSGPPGPGAGKPGWVLARMTIMCCAADAVALKVRIIGQPAPIPPNRASAADTWVEVDAQWVPGTINDNDPAQVEEPPTVQATRVRVVPAPAEPYE
jgi:uncharacterized repeat protein (TIGR03943 family)